MPASVCDAVIEPFYNKDIKLHLYNLDKKMSFNMDEIIDRINSKTYSYICNSLFWGLRMI